jgi:uncharacterized protein
VESRWLNPPPQWSEHDGTLRVVTASETDFWNRTFYGFTHDNGHLRWTEVSGDFTASVVVSADYEALYDQAGLMVLVDERTWMKCGIEHTDGAPHFSTVATRDDFSDWSQQPMLDLARRRLGVRITRHGEALRVQYRTEGAAWTMARLAMLPMADAVRVGPMCCSPTRSGLTVTFEHFSVAPPISRELHD